MTAVDRVAVVVPARNEERRIGTALAAIEAATLTLAAAHPAVTVRVVVVLDRCTDGTAAVLTRFPGVLAVPSTAGMVGAARSTGVLAALAEPGVVVERTWIATTDADSRVPADWLRHHVEIAREGADLLLGTVLPDPAELTAEAYDAWLEHNPQLDDHPYVHGANLGVRADRYLRVGGFRRVREHEDVLLATAVRASGAVVASPGAHPVLTSARAAGRTPGGFAGYLAELQRRPAITGRGGLLPALGQQ